MEKAFSFLLFLVVLSSGCLYPGSGYDDNEINTTPEANLTDSDEYAEAAPLKESVMWDYREEWGEWRPSSDPPECPSIDLESPVDVDLATSVLYPGQYRGEDYKPHGGFRFDDNIDNKIDVRAPFDGYVVMAGRYDFGNGVQHTFDIVHPCGIMYRLGHLLTPSPKFQELANELPEPGMDSRLHSVTITEVNTGELIATEVGLPNNVFVDWGVYDLRKENEASNDPSYREEFNNWRQFAFNSICWLDWLNEEDSKKARALPGADGQQGKESDYC